MASSSLLPFVFLPLLLLSSSSTRAARADEELVLTLDAGNFSEVVAAHQFVVVNFYAPKCYFCKKLAPEYEKAATILRNHDPPFVFAKIDASGEKNIALMKKYSVSGYPTIKVLRNRGNTMQEYLWERDAESIAKNLKKQAGPPSTEIKSVKDAASSIADRCLVAVGIFPEFDGSEYENFTAMAKKLRAYSDFVHTMDASILPRGDKTVKGPLVRLFRSFSARAVDSEDFDKHALEKFVRGCGYPTNMDTNPIVADRYLIYLKYFRSAPTNAILFLRFSDNRTEDFKDRIYKAARHYGTKNISFLVDDVSNPQGAFQYFKLNISEVPLMFVRESNATYMKPNVEPDQILPWFKEYSDGTLAQYVKSDPIREVTDQPVKIMVSNSLVDMVLNSGKNVPLEFRGPSLCAYCQQLAPIMGEVIVPQQDEEDVRCLQSSDQAKSQRLAVTLQQRIKQASFGYQNTCQ